jgi:inhibitor of cysteine peptidase
MRFLKLSWVKLVLGIFFLVSVAAHAEDTVTYMQDKPIVMVTTDNPEFIIKLKSNPTTGYSWFMRDYAANLIEPVKHEFLPPNNKLVGAPGYELWTFRARPDAFIVPQQTTIRFVYARPWEASDTTTQVIFKVTTAQARTNSEASH